jgi:hypothetical protein
MVAFAVVMGRERGNGPLKVPFTERDHAVEDSSLIEGTNRSACALQLGARNGVRITRTPAVARKGSTAALHFRSRSHISMRSRGEPPQHHSSGGASLDDKRLLRIGIDASTATRREWSSITNTV